MSIKTHLALRYITSDHDGIGRLDGVEVTVPAGRFPALWPRLERRRMQVAQRRHAGIVLDRQYGAREGVEVVPAAKKEATW